MAEIIRYEAACRALAQAKLIDEVKDIADKAIALKLYARQARNKDLEVDAAEIRLRAERRLGELLREQKEAGEFQKGRPGKSSEKEDFSKPRRLAEIGVDHKLSARAQKIAAVPQATFEAQMGAWRERVSQENERVTTALIKEGERAERNAAQEARREKGGRVEDLLTLIASGFKAGAILADPAWHFVTRSQKGDGRSAGQHYGTQDLDAIKALPVSQIAADDSVLFLWMLDWCPGWAFEVIAAWGFEHKTTAFTWVKQQQSGEGYHLGQGYWTRANPEVCLLATRGNPKRLNADVRQLLISPVMEHSRKPDEVHERIERMVAGPYLELNARRDFPGWVTWGDELAFIMPDTGEVIGIEEMPQFLTPREALNGGIPPLPAARASDTPSPTASALPPGPGVAEAAPRLSPAPLADGAASTKPFDEGPELLAILDRRGLLAPAQRAALTSAFSPSNDEVKPCP